MSGARLPRILLAGYPPSFRSRYGDELAALVADCPGGWRVNLDLARGLIAAWFRPTFTGPPAEQRRRRLQTTTATVFAAWSAATLFVAVFARAVDDQPVPGLRSWGWAAYQVGNVVFELSAAAILVAGFVYWLAVVVPAGRRRDRSVLVPACLPPLIVSAWLGATLMIAVLTRRFVPGSGRHISAQGPHTAAGWAILAAYAVFTVVCVVASAGSAIKALAAARLSERLLAASTVMGSVATGALLLVTGAACVCLTKVILVGHISARTAATAVVPAAALVLSSASAVVSSRRGVAVLTGSPADAD
jgi:hypothetical protein